MPPLLRATAALSALALAALVPVVTAGGAGATDDPLWVKQWAPDKIGAPAAWNATTGAGVKIGIVDSGVDLSHQDLQGKIVANASCIGTRGNPASCVSGGGQDIAGHGTHVAGIAAAIRDNGIGIAGIAPSAQLVVARVFQNDSADLADVEAGIKWVVDQGAQVINLSLGENVLLGGLLGGQTSLGPALNDAWNRGAIPVVASGNAQFLSGAASYANVNALVVGATGPDDEIASYSVSTGSAKWAVVAPGGNGGEPRQIVSTYWRSGTSNTYGYLQGTSMATPHVSGALALLLARGVSQQRAVEIVLATANRAVTCGNSCVGRLDIGAAVASTGPVTTTTSPPATAAPTTAAPVTTRPRVTTTRPPTTTTTATTTTTTPPPPETTVAPPPVTDTTPVREPLQVASAPTDDEDDVVLPGIGAGLLLALAAGGNVAARRRAGSA